MATNAFDFRFRIIFWVNVLFHMHKLSFRSSIVNLRNMLAEAINFLASVKKKGGMILFVGTGLAAKDIVRNVAEELNMPYVVERWLGGTLTNFPTISRRIDYLKKFEKYTKYETLKLEKKIIKLNKYLNGLLNLNRLPDAVWVSSGNYDKIAAVEAIKKSIPVAGIVNTNSDPALFNYPIPANDTALNSVSFILNSVKDALINVKSETIPSDK